MTVFRLRTGHNRLNYHLYSKLRIGHTEQCPCGTGSQTTEHLLQSCPICEPLRMGIWPDHTPVPRKLYGSLRDLQMHYHLHRGDWSFHLTNEKRRRRRRRKRKKKKKKKKFLFYPFNTWISQTTPVTHTQSFVNGCSQSVSKRPPFKAPTRDNT